MPGTATHRIIGRDPSKYSQLDEWPSQSLRSQGQYAKAELLFMAGLKQRQIALSETHPDTLKSMKNLANLYYKEGQFAKPEPLYMACLEQ